MQIEVSVKKPIRGGWSRCPARAAGSAGPAVAGVIAPATADRSKKALLISDLRPGVVGDSGPHGVGVHQFPERRAPRAAAGLDVAGQRLDLLDVHVRVQGEVSQVVRGITGADAVGSPVI